MMCLKVRKGCTNRLKSYFFGQVFVQTEEALPKYIEYIAAGAQYADEVGLTERAIYNSINMAADKSVLDAVA